MTQFKDAGLEAIETRIKAIRMTDSERLVAIAAMRHGFIIVDGFAALANGISRLAQQLFSRPGLAR